MINYKTKVPKKGDTPKCFAEKTAHRPRNGRVHLCAH